MNKPILIFPLFVILLFSACALLLAACAPASTAAPTPAPTATQPSPTEEATPSPTPTITEFDYSKINLQDRSTWNTEFSVSINGETVTINPTEYYAALPTRTVAEKGSELDKKYNRENQAFHIFLTRATADFLKGVGRDVSLPQSDADLVDYKTSVAVFDAYWKWQQEFFQETGTYDLSPTNPWLAEQMYQKENVVLNLRYLSLDGLTYW